MDCYTDSFTDRNVHRDRDSYTLSDRDSYTLSDRDDYTLANFDAQPGTYAQSCADNNAFAVRDAYTQSL